MRLRYLIFLTIVNAAMASDTTTVHLSHRTSEEMVSLLRPLLDPGEAAVPGPGIVIIKAPAGRLDDIESVINQLDVRAHRLQLTVAQGLGLNLESLSISGQTLVNAETPGTTTSAHIYGTDGQGMGQNLQRLQILDGKPAHISIGSAQPISTQVLLAYGPNGVIAGGQSTQYMDITSGFDAIPHVVGKDVVLDISPWSDNVNRRGDMRVDIHEIRTSIRIPIGEWVELGGDVDNYADRRSAIPSRVYTAEMEHYRVFVRIDEIE